MEALHVPAKPNVQHKCKQEKLQWAKKNIQLLVSSFGCTWVLSMSLSIQCCNMLSIAKTGLLYCNFALRLLDGDVVG